MGKQKLPLSTYSSAQSLCDVSPPIDLLVRQDRKSALLESTALFQLSIASLSLLQVSNLQSRTGPRTQKLQK